VLTYAQLMMSFELADTELPVRDDLVAAYRWYWDQLAQPGTWWTGE